MEDRLFDFSDTLERASTEIKQLQSVADLSRVGLVNNGSVSNQDAALVLSLMYDRLESIKADINAVASFAIGAPE